LSETGRIGTFQDPPACDRSFVERSHDLSRNRWWSPDGDTVDARDERIGILTMMCQRVSAQDAGLNSGTECSSSGHFMRGLSLNLRQPSYGPIVPKRAWVLVRIVQAVAMNATGILLGLLSFIVPSNGGRQH
jgi:hypothetical protein